MPHVDRHAARAAPSGMHLARLEHAQELRLHRGVELGDLVEEQRAAVGGLHVADRRRVAPRTRPSWRRTGGARRRPSGIAAQLTATNGPDGARRRRVEEARGQLLAGAALARQEQRVAVRRGARDLLPRVGEDRADDDVAVELDVAVLVAADVGHQHRDGAAGAHDRRRHHRDLAIDDRLAVDERAVAAAEIGDRERRPVPAHARVLARDPIIGGRRSEQLAAQDDAGRRHRERHQRGRVAAPHDHHPRLRRLLAPPRLLAVARRLPHARSV